MGLLVYKIIEWLTERFDAKIKARDDSRRGFEVLPPKGN